MVKNEPAGGHGKPGPRHGPKIALFPRMGVQTLVVRIVALGKWSEAAALGKADRRLQIAIGAIFISLGQRLGYYIIIDCMLAQALTDHRLRPAKAPLTTRHCHGKLLVVQITKLATVINCLLDSGGDIVWVVICQFASGEPLQYLCKLVARAGIAAKIIKRFVHHAQM